MKIGIEGQRLFRTKKYGMDRVALELIRNLQEIDHENEYYIFVKTDEDHSVLKETHNFKIVQLNGPSYPVWEQFILPKAAKKYGCQILHCTSNTAPCYPGMPLITTLHDIIYLERGYLSILTGNSSLYQKFGNVYRKLIVPRIVKKSKKIIAISHFEKNRIGSYFGINGDGRLRAIYNGVSAHFKPVTDKPELERVKAEYQLPDRFLFFMGNTDPRKNTRNTLKAFSDFLKRTDSNHKLVMLNFDRLQLEKLLFEMDDLELLNKVVLTGYVKDKDLPSIYSLSEIFLFPSLREGFGLPILEAMACGTPVITSNTSSMPEIAGDAAHIINPNHSEEITRAIITLISDEPYYKRLRKKGLERHQRFTWKIMAEKVLAIYTELNHKLNHKLKT